MKKILPFQISVIFLLLFACQSSVNNYPINFVERNTLIPPDKSPNPFLLVVEITENGKLRLNKIDTGTIGEPEILREKLKIIFDDRRRAGISEREIVIDPQGQIEKEDLEKLIESLAAAQAAPIRVIKKD